MVDYVAWGMADPLTVEQAACLWAGVNPSNMLLLLRPDSEWSAVAPCLQMLTGAIVSGELTADPSPNPKSFIGNHDKSMVRRADLMVLAESRDQCPPFLYDTMLKPGAEDASVVNMAVPPKNKGGRPPEWDWNAFILEIIRIANTLDGLPKTRAELAAVMRDWFIDQCDDHPADTTLEDRIRPIYQYLERPRKPPVK